MPHKSVVLKIPSWLILVAVSFACAYTAMMLFGKSSQELGIIRAVVSLEPSWHGETAVVLNPFGEITAATHHTPVRVKIQAEQLSKEMVIELVQRKIDPDEVVAGVEKQVQPFARKFIIKLLWIAALGGAIGALAGRRLRAVNLVAGGAAGIVFATIILFATWRTFDPAAFLKPEYRGVLADAPKLVSYIQSGLKRGEAYSNHMNTMSSNIVKFYLNLDGFSDSRKVLGDKFTILHVSDIHNNPIAATFVRRLADKLRPDVIVDTGDITDIGTPAELELVETLEGISVPHIFIAGNHDSADVVAALRDYFGVKTLDGGARVKINGVDIAGWSDPIYITKTGPHNADVDHAALERQYKKISRVLRKRSARPDVLLIHYPNYAAKIAGRVPLILTGHSHIASAKRVKDSVIVNSGTTGAAGIRNFKLPIPPAYSAAFITAHKGRKFTVESVDILSMNRNGTEIEFKRKYFSGGFTGF